MQRIPRLHVDPGPNGHPSWPRAFAGEFWRALISAGTGAGIAYGSSGQTAAASATIVYALLISRARYADARDTTQHPR